MSNDESLLCAILNSTNFVLFDKSSVVKGRKVVRKYVKFGLCVTSTVVISLTLYKSSLVRFGLFDTSNEPTWVLIAEVLSS